MKDDSDMDEVQAALWSYPDHPDGFAFSLETIRCIDYALLSVAHSFQS